MKQNSKYAKQNITAKQDAVKFAENQRYLLQKAQGDAQRLQKILAEQMRRGNTNLKGLQ